MTPAIFNGRLLFTACLLSFSDERNLRSAPLTRPAKNNIR